MSPHRMPTVPFMAGKSVPTFVGREKDLEDLRKIIMSRKVAAITGAEGIGKTELARVYAQKYRAEYPDGVFWASLKGSTWRQEAQKIISALNPETEKTCFFDEGKAKDEICKILNSKDALLIIDKVNEASEIIRPDCSVLITTVHKGSFGVISRIAVKELKGLSANEGIQLLEGVLGKDMVTRDLSGAKRIVEILEGMPLALQIAAHHLEAVPELRFSDYINKAQGKIEELKPKDSADKAVAISLEMSLEQLRTTPGGAHYIPLFEAAGVCPDSGFTSLTLVQTADLGDMAHVRVENLRQRMLLEFDPTSFRYSMHPLVRRLSSAMVKTNDIREFRYRENFCMHFLRFAQEHSTNPDILLAEKDGLWQAMTETRHIGRENELLPRFLEYLIQPFHQMTAGNDYEGAFRYLVATELTNLNDIGLVTDLGSILKILADNQAELQESASAWVFTNLGNVYIRLGEYAKALNFYEKALEIYDVIKDLPGQGRVLRNLGDVALRLGDYNKAISFYGRSLEVYRKVGDISGQGKVLGNMGIACAERGEHAQAIRFYEKQLEISRLTGNSRGESSVLGNMGLAYFELGDYQRAIGFYEKQLKLIRRMADAQAEGNALGNMGIANAGLGEFAKAIDLYKKQLEIHQRIGYALGEANAFGNMGMAYAKMGMHEEAHRCLEASKAIFYGLGLKDAVAQIEEMMQNAEHWIMRSVGVGQEKLTSATSLGRRTLSKKLKP